MGPINPDYVHYSYNVLITYPSIFVHWKPNRIINLYNLINGINVISPEHLRVCSFADTRTLGLGATCTGGTDHMALCARDACGPT